MKHITINASIYTIATTRISAKTSLERKILLTMSDNSCSKVTRNFPTLKIICHDISRLHPSHLDLIQHLSIHWANQPAFGAHDFLQLSSKRESWRPRSRNSNRTSQCLTALSKWFRESEYCPQQSGSLFYQPWKDGRLS
uniref:Uncharacterized protein n=1 Tax=Micrurus paraensis TaxID=1970185 RepID=A0A2D4KG56_9SAUR